MAALAEAETVELYWKPGCTSCLRMKEFVDKSGVSYDAINLDTEPQRAAGVTNPELYDGDVLLVPVACVADRCVSGLDLAAVAALIGVPYEAKPPLPAADLYARYHVLLDASCRFAAQMTPEVLAHELPGRKRPVLFIANQIASVGRAFLTAYYEGVHTKDPYYRKPESVESGDDIIARARETQQLFRDWWNDDGRYDALDQVIETYWGHRTLHEVFEREVWHTAQHTRQVMCVLDEFGIQIDGRLTDSDYAGLPMPERIHD